jgi:hypothetical protein
MIANLAKVLSGSALELPSNSKATAAPKPAATQPARAPTAAPAMRKPLQDTLKITNDAPTAVEVSIAVRCEVNMASVVLNLFERIVGCSLCRLSRRPLPRTLVQVPGC